MAKLITAFILMVSFVIAQPTGNPPCPDNGMDKPMMYGDHMRDEKDPRQMMETVRIWKMTQALDLTEDQSARLFPKMKEMRENMEQFQKFRSRIVGDLESYLRDPKKFAIELKAKLQELDLSEGKMHDLQQKLKREIANILSPEQQAKFMLFQMWFDKEMREMIQKAKEHRGDIRGMRKDFREGRRESRKLWKFW